MGRCFSVNHGAALNALVKWLWHNDGGGLADFKLYWLLYNSATDKKSVIKLTSGESALVCHLSSVT
tara:strand:- start:7650 stop:7847 length:198 start_codon:yes stop_codon:yes gene_type:complete